MNLLAKATKISCNGLFFGLNNATLQHEVIKFLSVICHSFIILNKAMKLKKDLLKVPFRQKLLSQLFHHLFPCSDFLLTITDSLHLQLLPPNRCMLLQFDGNNLHLLFLRDILVLKDTFNCIELIYELIGLYAPFIHRNIRF
jgi:hypothetical protein